jgi:uncharacterized membrane protein
MRRLAFIALALALAGPWLTRSASAQPGGWSAWRQRAWPAPLYAQYRERMSPEEREQLREQLRSADRNLYRNPQRGGGPRDPRYERQPGARQPYGYGSRMSPEQREQLRRDIMNAYRRRGRDRGRE